MRRFRKPGFVQANAAVLTAATLCLTLTGCGAPGPLASDVSDPCGNERAAFSGSKTYFTDQIVTGAATGAALGAGVGLLAGLASNGRIDAGAIIAGGLIGGVAGGTMAYANTLYQRARDQDEMANYMSADLATEAQEIDRTQLTFARLRACRFGQARFVKNQVRSRVVDRPTGLARIAYHRDHFNEELQLANQFGLTMAKRGTQFQEAANALRTRPPASQGGTAMAARARPSAQVAQVNRAATVSVPEKRAGFDRAVASAAGNSKAAFDIDSTSSLTWLQAAGFDA